QPKSAGPPHLLAGSTATRIAPVPPSARNTVGQTLPTAGPTVCAPHGPVRVSHLARFVSSAVSSYTRPAPSNAARPHPRPEAILPPGPGPNAAYRAPTTCERCVRRQNREICRTTQRSVITAPQRLAFAARWHHPR